MFNILIEISRVKKFGNYLYNLASHLSVSSKINLIDVISAFNKIKQAKGNGN